LVNDLPEQLIAQAEFLLGNTKPNEASVRRAVSTAYYALFHFLIRDAITNWKHTDHHSRLARTFDHKRMKDASAAILKEIGNATNSAMMADPEQAARFKLSIVSQAFIDLQQARHRADYDIGEALNALDAAVHVAQARLAVQDWAEVKDEPLAQNYLYSLLFEDRS
jgi:uncharacterized protein (UPF0332 family)